MSKPEFANILQEHFSPALARATDLVMEKGEGPYLYTLDGDRYLDMVQGIAVNALGHCHPALVRAATQQIEKLGHASFNLASFPATLEFGAELSRHTPGELNNFFLTNSGAEAVESALKLARFVSGRGSIIAFRGSFHGRTMGAASVTSSKAGFRRHYAPFLPQVYFAQYPYCYRCPFRQKPDSCDLDCLAYFKQDLDYIIPPDDVSAVLFEPVQGGGRLYRPAPALRRRTKGVVPLPRLAFDRRRGAERHGPHGQAFRLRAFRTGAGHPLPGQGGGRRLPHGGGGLAQGDNGEMDSRFPRHHLRRAPGGRGRRPGAFENSQPT